MADRGLPTTEDLEVALRDLADHIDHPQIAELSPAVMRRLHAKDEHPGPSRWSHAAIAAALLVTALLALPGPRHALADWLGIGTVRIIRTDHVPDGTGADLRLGREVTLDEAHATAPFTILGPSSLGPPSAVYAGEPSVDSVTLLWGSGSRVPEVAGTGVGVLLTEMPGSTEGALVEKQLGPNTILETTTVGDRTAYWIAGGQHELLYLDPDGRTRPDTTRLAANTLLWELDGVTYRLESRLDQDAAVDLASHLQPLR